MVGTNSEKIFSDLVTSAQWDVGFGFLEIVFCAADGSGFFYVLPNSTPGLIFLIKCDMVKTGFHRYNIVVSLQRTKKSETI